MSKKDLNLHILFDHGDVVTVLLTILKNIFDSKVLQQNKLCPLIITMYHKERHS